MSKACILQTNSKMIVFRENKSEFRIENKAQRQVEKHQVDGCLISNGIKCDWLLIDSETRKEAYIELKGSDVEHAINQIVASAKSLSKTPADKKLGYVICTKSPLNSTEIQRHTKALLQHHKIMLRVRKTVHTESIDAMF